MYRNYLFSKNETWFDYIKGWYEYMLDEEGNIKYKQLPRLDDMQATTNAFMLYARTGEKRYKNLLEDTMKKTLEYPRNEEGGFWHTEDRPGEMWLDGLYMNGPLVCKYANMFDKPEYYDISADQAILMEKKTLDSETGLWCHAYDENKARPWADPETGKAPEFWGRSIGWVPTAVLEEMDYIPAEHPKYAILSDMMYRLLTSVCKYQSEEGRWYQLVNKGHVDGNWLENSCSCLFTAALFKAVKKGVLDETYLEQAKKGYEAVINSLEWDGEDLLVGNVCVGTGVGDEEYYFGREVSANDLHGVGAFLIMCAAAQPYYE